MTYPLYGRQSVRQGARSVSYTSTGGVFIQLSEALLASNAGENMRSSSSSSSPWYQNMVQTHRHARTRAHYSPSPDI